MKRAFDKIAAGLDDAIAYAKGDTSRGRAAKSIKPVVFDEDNPEWTEEDFARARPASELPPNVLAAFPKTRLPDGRPPGSAKQAVSIRLDKDVLEKFRATGPGWQSRINEALKRARV